MLIDFCTIIPKNWRRQHKKQLQRFFFTLLCTKRTNYVLIDGKSFFDLPIKNEEEAYEKIVDMSINND